MSRVIYIRKQLTNSLFPKTSSTLTLNWVKAVCKGYQWTTIVNYDDPNGSLFGFSDNSQFLILMVIDPWLLHLQADTIAVKGGLCRMADMIEVFYTVNSEIFAKCRNNSVVLIIE